MYRAISILSTGSGSAREYVGKPGTCRFCGTTKKSDFGKRTNAHTFPESLGNKSLFSLDECKACNCRFSRYEDALCKAIGPFLTLGGVEGKRGVRQTGRTDSESVLKHSRIQGKRHQSIKAMPSRHSDGQSFITNYGDTLNIRFPVTGDMFVPLYAYKALLKIAFSLLPVDKLHLFQRDLECLQEIDMTPGDYPLKVGFSYASIGNAPPTIAGVIYEKEKEESSLPSVIALFQAGSVCFQIALKSEKEGDYFHNNGALGLKWKSMLLKPEGGYLPIEYSDPIQFDWSQLAPELQPVEAFELNFNQRTNHVEIKPVMRSKTNNSC